MAKQKNQYICQNCEILSIKWAGKCSGCAEWNSLVLIEKHQKNKNSICGIKTPKKFKDLSFNKEKRLKTNISEFDRVLGDGLVKGSVYLIGGEPGVGKSTLLLNALAALATDGSKCLYVCGEESEQQVYLRAKRLNLTDNGSYLIHECIWENIKEIVDQNKIEFVVIDSIQTTYSSEVASPAGSLAQIREVTHELVQAFKARDITALIVGHFTKDGSVAGPKFLEHMVDGVLKFESDDTGQYRMLRPVKNRFGSIDDVGLFEMSDKGLECVTDISNEKSCKYDGVGRSQTCLMQGHRPILAEIQALVLENKFNNIRRSPQGIDQNRLSMMVAVLEKYAHVPLSNFDIYINVINGFKLETRESDLSICASLISSFNGEILGHDSLYIGEIGLCGEVRGVTHIDKRMREASFLNFQKVFLNRDNAKKLASQYPNIECIGLTNVAELKDKIA